MSSCEEEEGKGRRKREMKEETDGEMVMKDEMKIKSKKKSWSRFKDANFIDLDVRLKEKQERMGIKEIKKAA